MPVNYTRQIERLVKKWAARREAADVEKQARWPSGAPGGKGGQFAPGKGNPGGGAHKPKGASQYTSYGSLFSEGSTFPGGYSPKWQGEQDAAPPKPPKGAKPHLKVNDKGEPVTINYPTKASDPSTWTDPNKTATFITGGKTPDSLNGVPLKPWAGVPKSENEWAAVAGQNPDVDADVPFQPTPGKSVGAGVIIREPDGRIWLTRPTNSFGGYTNTFPKGTVEHGLSMQASAIKEAWEETGLQVRITGVLGDYERTTSKARFYVAERVGGTPADMGWESQAIRLATGRDMRTLLNMKVDQGILDDLDGEGFFKAAAEKKPAKNGFNVNQPRWESGTPLGGQWKSYDAAGILKPPKVGSQTNPAATKKAEAVYGLAAAGNKMALLDAAVSLQKQVDANKAAGKSNYHAKELAKVSQYANALVEASLKKPTVVASADRITGPLKVSSLKAAGGKPGGSNPGGLYTDGQGNKLLVKGNAQYTNGQVGGTVSDNRAKNEVLAAKLMQAAGVGAPDMKLVALEGKHGGAQDGPGSLGVASKWVDGAAGFNPKDKSHVLAAQADYAVHAWLGNYDVMGQGFDNTVIKDGKAVNIDPGGAILFRAQGKPKDSFTADAPEWETMRTTTAEQKAVFGSMDKAALAKSAEKLASISDDTVKKLVETYGPGDAAAKADLAKTLIARRDAILAKAGLQKGPAVAGAATVQPAPTPEPPKMPDAVKVAGGAAPASATKPAFKESSPGAVKYYDSLVAKADELHAAGDLSGLKDLSVNPKSGKSAWPEKTVNGKMMQAYHDALVGDLEAKQAEGVKAVAAGTKTVTGKDGTQWTGDGKGVLQPTSKPATAPGKPDYDTLYAAVAATGMDMNAGKWTKVQSDLWNAAMMGNVAAIEASMPIKTETKAMKTALLGVLGQPQTRPASAPASAAPKISGTTLKAMLDEVTGKDHELSYYHPSMPMGQLIAAARKGDVEAIKATKGQGVAFTGFKAKLLETFAAAKSDMLFGTANALGGADAPAQPAPVVPKAAPPNFEAKKLPASNTNAPSHNAKIDAIKTAFDKGDEKALLALNYGTNTYGKKQAEVANAALAALGSVHTVTAGQKSNSHPALVPGFSPSTAPQAAAPQAASGKKRTLADLTPDKLPAVPDVMNWNGTGKPYSTKDWKNKANIAALQAIHTAALTGGIAAVDALKFPELDADTGAPTGKQLRVDDHPAKKLIVSYAIDVKNSINDFLNPPKKLAAFNVVNAKSVQETAATFLGPKIGQTVLKQAQDQQFGFWIALGKVADKTAVQPAAVKDLTDTEYSAGKKAYQGYSDLTKKWVQYVQSSGQINRAIDEGKTTYQGLNLKEVTKAIYKDATPVSAGSTVYRWQNMPSGMLKQIASAEPGLVFQSQGGMCTSKSATATSHFGKHRMIIRAAPGAKMIHSHGTGGYSNEQELTTIPGQRFVLLKKEKVGDRWDFEVLMLPPDEGFVA